MPPAPPEAPVAPDPPDPLEPSPHAETMGSASRRAATERTPEPEKKDRRSEEAREFLAIMKVLQGRAYPEARRAGTTSIGIDPAPRCRVFCFELPYGR